ncbi:MAG: rhodanese-like domain-containing protein [Clostridia bacterium]|nr:rhodanese-like domain-containing protein [Clostridia bacterium]
MESEVDICEFVENRPPDAILLDVREKITFSHGNIPGSVNIPLDELSELYSLPKDKKIYVYCQADIFSKEVVYLLRDEGYEAYNLSGGYRKYLLEYLLSKKTL